MYAILVPEIRDDPLSRGYATMTDEQVAASLNAVDRPPRLAPLGDVEEYVSRTKTWGKIQKSTKDASATFVRWIKSTRADHLNIDDAEVATVLADLVDDSLLTSAQLTAIEALAVASQSRATELGMYGVSNGHIKSARQMIAEA